MIFSLKVPLYPTDEQKIYMHSMSDICHKLQNTAVSYLKHNDDFIDESLLRTYLLERVVSELPVSFITNVVAKEKHRAYMKFGSERLNFIRYSYVSKSFPVRCDANSGRLSRIYLKGNCIKIPSIDGFVVISRNWLRKNSDLVDILNGKKQSARVIFDGKYWYLVFSYNTEAASIELKDKVIGVDLGIKTLVVTSDNEFKDGVHKEGGI